MTVDREETIVKNSKQFQASFFTSVSSLNSLLFLQTLKLDQTFKSIMNA